MRFVCLWVRLSWFTSINALTHFLQFLFQDDRHERLPTYPLGRSEDKRVNKMEEELKIAKKTIEKLQTERHEDKSELNEVKTKLDEAYSETLVVKTEFAKQMTESVKKAKEIDCLKTRLQVLEDKLQHFF